MKFLKTDIPEVLIAKPEIYSDDRGTFMETYQKKVFESGGIPESFVQDNHSSSQWLTLRGLHYQITHTQGKLVRAVIGKIFDVAVDLRRKSPYFGHWVGAFLSDENKQALWVPPGFAHGFLALSERVDVTYKATDFYDPSGERCIRWDDPTLAIAWPIPDGETPIVSQKDAAGISFKDAEVFE